MRANLKGWELQELMFLCGSKKEFAKTMGLSQADTTALMTQKGVKTPTDYLRAQPREALIERLVALGSYAKMATRYGTSPNFLSNLMKTDEETADLTAEGIETALKRYGSFRLAARCLNTTEFNVRTAAKRFSVDYRKMIIPTKGHQNNAKGRRAELEYAKIRGRRIVHDANIVEGSKADYDFLDKDHGKVNVKSSRMYRYKNRESYWKFSTHGRDNADNLALMFYDRKMENLIGFSIIPTSNLDERNSIRLQENAIAERV